MKEVNIAGQKIGPGNPCFIIAEAGVNHNGDKELAKMLVDVAVDSGADAIKFQTFNVNRLLSPTAPKAQYQLETTDTSESQFEMLRALELSSEGHRELSAYCQKRDLIFLSTPFDELSSDFLDDLGVPAFKIPSGETVNLPLLRHVASKGKPLILSTGMSYLSEVESAVRTIRQTGNEHLVVLHCVSNYPAVASDINLNAMYTMTQAFQVPVGYSDHTNGIEVPLAAVAMGASVIEKHFTLDRNMSGPDHRASLEPDELVALVSGIRKVEQAMGNGIKEPADSEANTKQIARRSLYLARDVAEGGILSEDDLIALRPAGGISPHLFDDVLGRRLRYSLPAGQALAWVDMK